MMNNSKKPLKTDTVIVSDITFSHEDLFKVVDDFYTRIQNDSVLQVPFASVHDWPDHVERLTHFWWIRFGGKPYLFNDYNPVPKHYFAGFNEALLTRWLSIFDETLKTHLTSQQSDLWTLIAKRMGQALSMKNDLFKEAISNKRS